MAKKIYRGDAINVAQQSLIPSPPDGFDGPITLGISNKSLTFEEWNAATIAAAWNAAQIPEIRTATASVHADGVLLTATQAGVPFEVWARFGDSSQVDESFLVVLSNVGESQSGTYELTAFGETITLAPDATAAEVTTALEATSAIAPGDVSVELVATSPQRQYRITLGGSYAGVDVPDFTVDGDDLRGGSADILAAELQEFSEPQNTRVRVNINGTPTSGDHDLVVGGTEVGPIAHNANLSAIQAAFDADLGSGEAVVSNVSNGGGSTLATYEFELQGSLAATGPTISAANSLVPTAGNTIWEIDATTAAPSQPGILRLYDSASGSPVLVDSAGSATTGHANRVTLDEGLTEILTGTFGAGNYQVTKSAGVYSIELIGGAAGAQPSYDDYSWTWTPIADDEPPAARFSWTKQQAGGASQPQQFRVAFDGTQLSGAWALKVGAHTSASINLSDNAAAIETKVEALTPIGAGNVTVSGSYASGWTFELDPSLGQLDLSTVSVVNNLSAVNAKITYSQRAGSQPYQETVNIAFEGNPTGGLWGMRVGGVDLSFSYNVTAGTIGAEVDQVALVSSSTVSWTPGVGGSMTVHSANLMPAILVSNISLIGPKPAVTITGLQDYQAAANTRYRLLIDWRANDGYIRFRNGSAYQDQYLNGGEATEEVLAGLISGALADDITRQFVEVTADGDQVHDFVFDGDDLSGNDYTITAENQIAISNSYSSANSTTEATGTDGVSISLTTLQVGSAATPAQHSLLVAGSPHFGTFTLDVEASDGGEAGGPLTITGTNGGYCDVHEIP